MDLIEAILCFVMGVVILGFLCVLFNAKFKTFCKIFLFNAVNFFIYITLVVFSILKYSSFACCLFGACGLVGFIMPIVLIYF